MIYILYISLLIISFVSLWVIISQKGNYIFKAIFIPALFLVVMSTWYTYNSLMGFATVQNPPEVVKYLSHITDKHNGWIYLTILNYDKKEPRMYQLPWNEELEKELDKTRQGQQQGVIKYGKMRKEPNATDENNQGKWLWYDMPPSEVMPKNYEGDDEMETSENGIELIKEFEGRRLVAYQDSVGVWTIGYGHTKDVWEDRLIIKKTADRLLAEDLAEFEKYVDNLVEVPLTQNQFDALVAWTFNLGPTNLSESTLLKKLNAGDYDSVPSEMKRWNKAGGEVLEGLVRRREAEAALFNA